MKRILRRKTIICTKNVRRKLIPILLMYTEFCGRQPQNAIMVVFYKIASDYWSHLRVNEICLPELIQSTLAEPAPIETLGKVFE